MRRLVALPIKTLAVIATLLAGAVYVAAEARQAVVQHDQLELARLESGFLRSTTPDRAIHKAAVPSPGKLTILPSDSGNVLPPSHLLAQLPAPKPEEPVHTRQIIISITDRRLALLEDGKLVKTYPIATGAKSSPSPDGEFTIINHAVDPVYRHKGKEIQPGDGNPLGSRWMGLSLKGYGIHGTNVPRSIGKAASHGCFRMAKADVEDLYNRVKVGDTVIIRKERDELIARTFEQKTFAQPVQPHAEPSASAEVQLASAAAAEPAGATATTTQQ